jgi:hypothetical protein
VDTPEERAAWIDEIISGRLTLGGPPGGHSEFSVKDTALREALSAFCLGLFVSTVLCAWSYCEIEMIEGATQPATQRNYAEHAVKTMLDLWAAQGQSPWAP